MAKLRIGIIGFGKIAHDQHVPAIAGNAGLELVGVVTPDPVADTPAPLFANYAAMLRYVELDAVAICTPPGPRYEIARPCLEAGLHVLLEKPPCATLGQVADLAALADARGLTLFTAWHSQFNSTVAAAAEITRREELARLEINWLEDVDKWHPGQEWIWDKGGFGVFDPGINAFSIATLLSPTPLFVRNGEMRMHARGQQPEALTLTLGTAGANASFPVTLDFRHKDGERWTIDIVTQVGTRIALSQGGSVLRIGDGAVQKSDDREYPALYATFAELIAAGRSQVDAEPLRLVADALLVSSRVRRARA